MNSQLLALFIKMAALQLQRFGCVADVMVLAFDFVQNHLPSNHFFDRRNGLGQLFELTATTLNVGS
jgi:hypothetical protein